MKVLFEILQWIPFVIIGFIVLALAMRITAKILFRTFYEEKSKHKNEKEKHHGKNERR
jgi:Na+-transporting methylmalonyl-CoA/oxaloacetate decarboxylase gamma subunit